jgi:hypothetical protein
MRSRYPDDDTTYVALVRDATLKVHEYLRKDPARLFKDARYGVRTVGGAWCRV